MRPILTGLVLLFVFSLGLLLFWVLGESLTMIPGYPPELIEKWRMFLWLFIAAIVVTIIFMILAIIKRE